MRPRVRDYGRLMQTMPKDLLLVGSIPLSSAEQVFRTCAETVGDLVDCLPDGEYDERIWWVNQQAWRVFHPHPDITTLKRPRPIDGVEQWKPVSVEDYWKFKLGDGVTELRFDNLTYADAAIESYDDFRRLRDEKVIPRDVRFQVCVPMTNSAIDCFFDDPDEYPILNAAYEDAMRREIERMVENIPPEDLVIQWDCCVEILDVEGLFPWTPAEDSFERNVDPFGHVTPAIPERFWSASTSATALWAAGRCCRRPIWGCASAWRTRPCAAPDAASTTCTCRRRARPATRSSHRSGTSRSATRRSSSGSSTTPRAPTRRCSRGALERRAGTSRRSGSPACAGTAAWRTPCTKSWWAIAPTSRLSTR